MTNRDTAIVHDGAAHCLGYPDPLAATGPGGPAALRAALAPVRHPAAGPLRAFLDRTEALPATELAAHYVETFDFTRRHSLYLSWWTDGDTRARGAALVRFKEAYRAHGLEFTGGELPDFLPAVLEFAALTGSDALLREHRPALELLRLALTERDTPYALVLDAVCATLPGPSPRDRAAALALARGGPPGERVGLEAGAAPYGHLGLLPVLPSAEPAAVTGDHP
ncbi:nitrate reductase molybdenum cofactor assembly chaperone [Kitasatospora sp. NPDC004240]